MNLKFSVVLFLIFFEIFSAQQKVKIVDAETQQPIPYAKLLFQGRDDYKNTEENGEIILEENEQISEIQSFGYENLKVERFQNVFALLAKPKEIEEVKIYKPKFEKEITLGKIIKNRWKGSGFLSSENLTWVVSDLIEPQKNIPNNMFIKKIRFLSAVHENKENVTIKLNIYENENGKPSSEILKSYIVNCKPGYKINELNLEKHPILFPENGLFIGFEWIINNQNQYEENVTFHNSDGKTSEKKIIFNNPSIKAQNSLIDNIWGNSKGSWFKISKFQNKNKKAVNFQLSVEVDLTN